MGILTVVAHSTHILTRPHVSNPQNFRLFISLFLFMSP